MKKAITYYRVSTERQGMTGLGLEAQKKAVREFANTHGFLLTSEFVEIESSRKNERPLLSQALSECKREQATLLIARLDRLGRNVAFISKLMEAGVDFKAVDNPHASKLVVHIMAAFAEHERDLISERTIAALKAAKEKGVELGKHGRYVQSLRNKEYADDFALAMRPVLRNLQQEGIITLRAMAEELNSRNVQTSKGNGRWHANTVRNIMKRIVKLSES